MFSKLFYQKQFHAVASRGSFVGKFHPGGSNMEDAANSKSSLQRLYLWPQGGALWEREAAEVMMNKLRELTGEASPLVTCFFWQLGETQYVNHVNLWMHLAMVN